MFGKHHNVPPPEHTAAGPFNLWPTGLGFEYFYGFISGETDQWNPVLYRGTTQLDDDDGSEGLVDRRLASDAIRWLHNHQLAAPEKPFFIYLAPGSTHSPHQAPPDQIERFKGQFDAGWDVMRETIFRRQLASGIIPRGTKLTPRPDGIPAWDSLTPVQKRFATRSMEVAAAMLAYQDEQLGRILGEMGRMGIADKTIVLTVIGDNGASGEGGPFGVFNQFGTANGIQADDKVFAATIDKLGGPEGTSNYPVGWGWAMNTPFRWTKQYASMLGGIRDGMIMAWAGHVSRPGSVCAEFGHLVDVAPTLYEAAGVPAPATVNGIVQKPMDGESLLPSLQACNAKRPRTQYFEMQGKAGLYHDGWFASSDNGRKPWELSASTQSLSQWSLFDLRQDFSQSTDVSAQHPKILTDMIALWRKEAQRNNVFPINSGRSGSLVAGPTAPRRKTYEFWGKGVGISAHPEGLGSPSTFAGSFTLTADLDLSKPEASGVILALGGHGAGWSFFLDRGKPVFTYARSSLPGDSFRIASTAAIPSGAAHLSVRYKAQGPYKPALVEIFSGDRLLAEGQVERTWIIPLEIGEMLDAGRDTGVSVTEYLSPHGELEGDIRYAAITLN
jgi:arylsulfatase A-like enzyme